MFQTLFTVNPDHYDSRTRRGGAIDLSNPSAMHRTICALFPEVPQGQEPRVVHRVLHRQDGNNVLLQSAIQPDLTTLPEGYLLGVHGPRPMDRFLASLRAEEDLRFKLLVSPYEKDERDKRRSLNLEASVEWVLEKQHKWGFMITEVYPEIYPESPFRQLRGRASRQQPRNNSLQFCPRLLEGMLQVTDADKLRATLVQGIGPGKAFGLGMLSIKRP